MPPAVGALWWLAFRQPCTTPYIPFHFGMKETPEEMALILSKLSLEGPFRAVGIV